MSLYIYVYVYLLYHPLPREHFLMNYSFSFLPSQLHCKLLLRMLALMCLQSSSTPSSLSQEHIPFASYFELTKPHSHLFTPLLSLTQTGSFSGSQCFARLLYISLRENLVHASSYWHCLFNCMKPVPDCRPWVPFPPLFSLVSSAAEAKAKT